MTIFTIQNRFKGGQAGAIMGGLAHALNTTLLILLLGWGQVAHAQLCGFVAGAGEGCANTDYNNFGLTSSNPATIEYDNFVSTFHSTAIRNSSGEFQVWGARMSATNTNVLSPLALNSTNFPNLGTHRVLKVAAASIHDLNKQFIALTTDGLYAWGETNTVFNSTLKSTVGFGKVGVTNGNAFSLPAGITPSDVKMMTASLYGSSSTSDKGTLIITTCSGEVWVLAMGSAIRGNGGATSSSSSWTRVLTSAGVPLSDVAVTRINANVAFALRNDNTLWVWGRLTELGNGTTAADRTFATQMVHPNPSETIKMIGLTGDEFGVSFATRKAYFVLMTNGKLYATGFNGNGVLGDWTTTNRNTWVQPKYTSAAGPVMDNIKWISTNEQDNQFAAINAINSDGHLYAWGRNSAEMLGIGTATGPTMPSGITTADKVLAVETGGHTSMVIKECSVNFGYVGHRISGSMGNGSAVDIQENTYTFNTAGVSICGAEPITVSLSATPEADGSYCTNTAIPLQASPAGGTFTVASGTGAATITGGNMLTITSAGTVTVTYDATSVCGVSSSKDIVLTGSSCVSVPSCIAGSAAPTLSSTSKANSCPTTTVNLTTITASNLPANTTLTWHTGTPATTANKIAGTAVAAGTYYAAFFDATGNCYSGTSGAGTTAVTATVSTCPACNAGTTAPNLNN